LVGSGFDGVLIDDPHLVDEGLVAETSEVVVEAHGQVVGVAGEVEDVSQVGSCARALLAPAGVV